MLHHPIFTEKYLKTKLNGFSLDKINDLDKRKKVLTNWINSLNSGRIAKTKEQSIQSDFLNRIFGDVLGYEYRDSYQWNLDKEHGLIGGKRADGALGFFRMNGDKLESDVRVVIELKDANTDLDKPQNRKDDKRSPVEQGFSYASKAGGHCKWIIVSNFKEIRLYHSSDQGRYELFKLPELLRADNLVHFFLLLKSDHLITQKGDSFVDDLYEEKQEEEKQISEKFYNTYKNKRLQLFKHLKNKNPGLEELIIFNKTQKLIDRLIFIFFCEDISLIPPYTVQKIRDISKESFDMSNTTVWRQLKGLFQSINKGNPPHNINKFNGGLFETDKIIDELLMEDDVLLDILKLADYDFSSDLNVNILGHIFEQSISDIEEIKAEIKGEDYDKKTGKRKKEGIYYTPEYITRYIVKESIGGWLDDRKDELGFDKLPELQEKDYNSIKEKTIIDKELRKKRKIIDYNKNIEKHIKFWEAYKEKLSNIKVLDPACGSGAFLNQAFDYLYSEGQKVNEHLSKLKGGMYSVFDLDKHILNNNIFGVDLNSESVEITKLSLWLKTARKDKELTALDKNIKCGNSLIDDAEVAGNDAFDWNKEFPEIMESGGFDVIVGNPPYGAKFKEFEIEYLKKVYNTFEYQINSYVLFYESGIKLLKKTGYLGYITPATFTYQHYFKKIRNLLSTYLIVGLTKYLYKVFDDAETGDTVSFILKKTTENNDISSKIILSPNKRFNKHVIKILKREELVNSDGTFNISEMDISKFYSNSEVLSKTCESIIAGIKPYQKGKGKPKQTAEDVKQKKYTSSFPIDNTYIQCINGKDFHRYKFLHEPKMYLSYGKWLAEPRFTAPFFDDEKIILRQTADSLIGHIDTGKRIALNNVYLIGGIKERYNIKYILGLINSKLFKAIYQSISQEKGRTFAEVKRVYLAKLPVKKSNAHYQNEIANNVDSILSNNIEITDKINNFFNLLTEEYNDLVISQKLYDWNNLTWKVFDNELKKQKITLKGEIKEDWFERFNRYKYETIQLQEEINQTDEKIDKIVYELYGLTPEEIKIVEASE